MHHNENDVEAALERVVADLEQVIRDRIASVTRDYGAFLGSTPLKAWQIATVDAEHQAAQHELSWALRQCEQLRLVYGLRSHDASRNGSEQR